MGSLIETFWDHRNKTSRIPHRGILALWIGREFETSFIMCLCVCICVGVHGLYGQFVLRTWACLYISTHDMVFLLNFCSPLFACHLFCIFTSCGVCVLEGLCQRSTFLLCSDMLITSQCIFDSVLLCMTCLHGDVDTVLLTHFAFQVLNLIPPPTASTQPSPWSLSEAAFGSAKSRRWIGLRNVRKNIPWLSDLPEMSECLVVSWALPLLKFVSTLWDS